MTGEQIGLVRTSHAMVEHRSTAFALRFYDRLFVLDPALRPLFGHDFGALARALMKTLGIVVAGLDDPAPLMPALHELARRHVVYGVRARHYPTVGTALVDTFGEVLGDRFTPDMAAAWTVAYASLSGAMIAAAAPLEALRDD